jgi:hypothetical protein
VLRGKRDDPAVVRQDEDIIQGHESVWALLGERG